MRVGGGWARRRGLRRRSRGEREQSNTIWARYKPGGSPVADPHNAVAPNLPESIKCVSQRAHTFCMQCSNILYMCVGGVFFVRDIDIKLRQWWRAARATLTKNLNKRLIALWSGGSLIITKEKSGLWLSYWYWNFLWSWRIALIVSRRNYIPWLDWCE